MVELIMLFQTPTFSIAHDSVNHWLYVTWEGGHNVATSQENCARILRQVQLTKACCILNDSSLVLDGWNEVTEWLGKTFFPALADEGVRAVAWVKAQDWPAQLAIERTIHLITRPIVDTFDNTYEAYAWLLASQSY